MEQNNNLILKGDEFSWLQEINEDGYEFVLDEDGNYIRGIFIDKNDYNNDLRRD